MRFRIEYRLPTLILWLTLLSFGTQVYSQTGGLKTKKNSPSVSVVESNKTINFSGSVLGKVRDSTYKFVLSNATVSIYRCVDSSLIKFTIPNDLGEFSLPKIPVNTKLKISVTHVGYTPFEQIFSIDEKAKQKDLGWIYMSQNSDKANTLREVEITSYAPVRMNGDTIEFNPRAFKMDVNATAEDLMRQLPGMVIWGDGDITFNGKKINSLLVDGKPFMGGGITTATQNLPKEALDRVQIYSQRNDHNPLDSTLHANLKLKDDAKKGYFGKISTGYGTNRRYAIDGMMSAYSKKLQLSTVGAFNNTNKSANDINTLIRNSSYKGEGSSTEYQSDFKKAGINISTVAGSRFQYDFQPEVNQSNVSRLIGHYFFKHNNEDINSRRITNTLIGADSVLSNNSVEENKNISMNNSFNTNYLLQRENFNFNVSTEVHLNTSNRESQNVGSQTRTGTPDELSSSTSVNTVKNTQSRFTFETKLDHRQQTFDQFKKTKRYLLSDFSVNYKFDYEKNSNDRSTLSAIESIIQPTLNKTFNRLYEANTENTSHIVDLNYPNLKKLIFGFANLGGINLNFKSKMLFDHQRLNTVVLDVAEGMQQNVENTQLTNNRLEYIYDMRPEIVLSKNFIRGLTNRYNQVLDINISSRMQYYGLQSMATKQIQDLSYNYKKFVPQASITYRFHQYGSYELGSSLNYDTHVSFPSVERLAPLVDSASLWYLARGNMRLKPDYTNELTWKASFESRTPKNPFQIEISLDTKLTNNKIADSVFYDRIGRRINYNVNLDGYKFFHMGGYFRKAYSPNKNYTYRLSLWHNRSINLVPQYFDDALAVLKNIDIDYDLELSFSYLDLVNVNAKQGISLYTNSQTNSSQKYSGSNYYTRLTSSFQLVKSLSCASNITFNANKAKDQETVRYAIWNASVNYRFLRGKNGEIKFSALDLLRQNRSVVNSTNRNVQIFGYNNVLQQYFMTSISYFPRKFGKK
jgi:hypothetical protein